MFKRIVRGPSPSSNQTVFSDVLKYAKMGNVEAIAYLYRHSQSCVFTYIYKRIADRETADDLTSDVFLIMIENIHALKSDNEAGFRAWILKIARTQIVQYYRAREKISLCSLDQARDIPYEISEERSEILEAFKVLTTEQRLALAGKFVYGYDASELASMSGKGTDAIRALQSRGAKALRRNLAARYLVILLLFGSLLGIGYAIKVARSHNTVNKIRFLEKHLGHFYYQEKKHHYSPPVTPSIQPTTTSTPTSTTTPTNTSTSSDATIQNPTPTPTSTPSGAIHVPGVCIAGLCLST